VRASDVHSQDRHVRISPDPHHIDAGADPTRGAGVKALIDPQSRDVFAFQAQIVPANRVAVPSP
jgi:hypothetical protein